VGRGASYLGWGYRSPGVTVGDLKLAIEFIGTSCLCNMSFSAPPDTKWDEVTSNTRGAKHMLREAIELPCMQRRAFEALGLQPPGGCCSMALRGAKRQCW
jgi:SpoVK/Ycf46/Vps4 family AAA+-type ATPase